jgi:hypothetical protein
MDCFVASAPRNDVAGVLIQFSNSRHTPALSRRDASELCFDCRPRKTRGRREDQVRAAPAVSRAISTSKCAHEHTGSAETLRPFPAQWLYGLYVLTPAIRICLSPSPCEYGWPAPGWAGFASAELDANPEAVRTHTISPYATASFVSVPSIAHGSFANPPCHHVSRPTLPRPSHPCPTFVTIMIRLSERAGTSMDIDLIWVGREAKYFGKTEINDLTGKSRLSN